MIERASELTIEAATYGGSIVVHPSGTLNVDTYPLLRDGLLKYAAEAPDAVLVDLDSLGIERQHLLSVFSLVWMRVADWPGVPIMLVSQDGPTRRGLLRNAMSRYVPIHTDVAEAVAALEMQPTRRRTHTELGSTATASADARALVRETCARWGLDGLVDDVQLVATELVENTLKHTNAEPSLRLDLRRGMLTVAVSDDSPVPPTVREASPRLEGGRGMHLVAELARTWGCSPTLAGGKVVWAVLSVRRDNRIQPFFGAR